MMLAAIVIAAGKMSAVFTASSGIAARRVYFANSRFAFHLILLD